MQRQVHGGHQVNPIKIGKTVSDMVTSDTDAEEGAIRDDNFLPVVEGFCFNARLPDSSLPNLFRPSPVCTIRNGALRPDLFFHEFVVP